MLILVEVFSDKNAVHVAKMLRKGFVLRNTHVCVDRGLVPTLRPLIHNHIKKFDFRSPFL